MAWTIVLIAALAGLTLALTPRMPSLGTTAPGTESTTLVPAEAHSCVIAEPENLTFQDLLGQADVLFTGKVTGYAPSEGFFHDIHIHVIEDLGGIRQPPEATVAMAGSGPLDNCPGIDHDPKIGEQVAVFARTADLNRGNGLQRGVEVLSLYVLGADGLYHGGPNNESVSPDALRQRIGQHTSDSLTPEDIGIHLQDPPAGMTPAVSRERAIALAAHNAPGYLSDPAIGVTARLVMFTDRVYYHVPAWLVTFTGVTVYGSGGGPPPPGMIRPTPRPNHEVNVVIDARDGTQLEMFSYR